MQGKADVLRAARHGYRSDQLTLSRMSFSPEMKEAGLSSCFGRLDEKESRYVVSLYPLENLRAT